jgi:hypothetical protein
MQVHGYAGPRLPSAPGRMLAHARDKSSTCGSGPLAGARCAITDDRHHCYTIERRAIILSKRTELVRHGSRAPAKQAA